MANLHSFLLIALLLGTHGLRELSEQACSRNPFNNAWTPTFGRMKKDLLITLRELYLGQIPQATSDNGVHVGKHGNALQALGALHTFMNPGTESNEESNEASIPVTEHKITASSDPNAKVLQLIQTAAWSFAQTSEIGADALQWPQQVGSSSKQSSLESYKRQTDKIVEAFNTVLAGGDNPADAMQKEWWNFLMFVKHRCYCEQAEVQGLAVYIATVPTYGERFKTSICPIKELTRA